MRAFCWLGTLRVRLKSGMYPKGGLYTGIFLYSVLVGSYSDVAALIFPTYEYFGWIIRNSIKKALQLVVRNFRTYMGLPPAAMSHDVAVL